MPLPPPSKEDVERALRESSGASTSQIRESPKQALADFAVRSLDRVRTREPLPPTLGSSIQVFESKLEGSKLLRAGNQSSSKNTPTVSLPILLVDRFVNGSLIQSNLYGVNV